MTQAAVSRYQQNDVSSMSPAKRVVFLYGQVLVNLRQAGRHLTARDIEPRARCLLRAQDIIAELLASLDLEQGGQIALNLAHLYGWMLTEIAAVDRKQDAARLERLVSLVADLHGAWDQAEQQLRALAPGATADEG